MFHTPLPIDEADPGVWYLHTDAARDITAICCWWLLRGIEAAAAKMHHVWRQHTALATTTFFTLPIQKNDTTGMCVSRGHNCICERQKKNPICPHCAMIRREKRVRTLFPRNNTIPFIPEPEGTHPSKQTIIQIFRRAIQSTGTTLQRPGPQGEQIQRFSEHVQSLRCPIPHSSRIQPRRSTTHRTMGIRCHQEVHPRLTTGTTPPTYRTPNRRSHPQDRPRPDDQVIQPVLDRTQQLRDHPHTSYHGDLHRQQEMAHNLWLALWDIHIPEDIRQTGHQQVSQMFPIHKRSGHTRTRPVRIGHRRTMKQTGQKGAQPAERFSSH